MVGLGYCKIRRSVIKLIMRELVGRGKTLPNQPKQNRAVSHKRDHRN